MDIKAPTEFCKPSVTIVEDKHCKNLSYEVYFVYEEDTSELLYVGCGKKGRHKHVFSGSSQNVMLNVYYVFSVDLRICVFGCKTKEEALDKEAKGIEEYRPRFNNLAKDQTPTLKVKGRLVIEDIEGRFRISAETRKVLPIKDVIALYQEDREACERTYPEWYPIIDKLGVKVANAYHRDKSTLKSLYKAALAEESVSTHNKISNDFKPGDVYSAAYIKEYLQSLGITNAKATTLGKWYLLKRTTKEGVTCYRIVQRLTDTLVN